jgi:hypothetical protein
MSLLTIITGACGQLNITQPTAVVAASDLQTKQLLALSRVEARDLNRRFDWQATTKEATFTTVAAETQTALTTAAPDFDQYINGTMWNRTRFWQVGGPLTQEQWQRRKAAAAQVGVRNWFRIRGNNILFYPTPTAGDTIYFEYISNKWCQSSLLVAQTDWLADTDTALLDEEVIRLGVVWRFLKAKGLDYSEEFRTYEMALDQIFGSDGGRQTIDMTGSGEGTIFVNIPDGNWTF